MDWSKEYSNLMQENILETGSEAEKINKLGSLIDASFYLKKKEGFEKTIELSEELLSNIKDKKEKTLLYYYVGNAYMDYDALINKEKDTIWLWQRKELEKAIINYRLAISQENINYMVNARRCQVYTNLGNHLSSVGRFVEAIRYWNEAIKLDPNFSMALGNMGRGFYFYSQFLYDNGHRFYFLKMAHKYLLRALKIITDEGARKAFKPYLGYIEKMIDKKDLITEPVFKKYKLGRGRKEQEYRKWCLVNKLFLNPLNDLGTATAFAQDILHMPPMTIDKSNPSPRFQGFYNQIKQEFITARYLYYCGVEKPKEEAFVNNDINLIDTLDYPEYGIATEKIKLAYRLVYSILDKIAFFLAEYYELGLKPYTVSFKTIFGKYDKDSKTFIVREEFQMSKNHALRGLFWLSKDFYEKNTSYVEALEPEAIELANLRNHLEHKYLKLHLCCCRNKLNWKNEPELFHDTLALSIQVDDFKEKAMKLIKLVREAVMYLSLAVNIEENKKRTNENSEGIVAELPLDTYKFF